MKKKAFTLIELVVGLGMLTLVLAGGAYVFQKLLRESLTKNRIMDVTVLSRDFFSQRSKVFSAASEDFNLQIFSPDRGGLLESLSVTTSGCFSDSFTEKIEIVCDVRSSGANDDRIAQSEMDELWNCSPCGGAGQRLSDASELPRVQITRNVGGNITTMHFPSPPPPKSSGGDIIGAALCMSVSDPNTYRDVRFQLITILRLPGNQLKLIKNESTFPRPKILGENSIKVGASGCGDN